MKYEIVWVLILPNTGYSHSYIADLFGVKLSDISYGKTLQQKNDTVKEINVFLDYLS